MAKLDDIFKQIEFSEKALWKGYRDSQDPLAYSAGEKIKSQLAELKEELKKQHGNPLPIGIATPFEFLDHVVDRFEQWATERNIFKNKDFLVFDDYFVGQIDELKYILENPEQTFG